MLDYWAAISLGTEPQTETTKNYMPAQATSTHRYTCHSQMNTYKYAVLSYQRPVQHHTPTTSSLGSGQSAAHSLSQKVVRIADSVLFKERTDEPAFCQALSAQPDARASAHYSLFDKHHGAGAYMQARRLLSWPARPPHSFWPGYSQGGCARKNGGM